MDHMWGAASNPWIPISSLHGSYVKRIGPVAGGHGSVGMENGARAYGANVFYTNKSIF